MVPQFSEHRRQCTSSDRLFSRKKGIGTENIVDRKQILGILYETLRDCSITPEPFIHTIYLLPRSTIRYVFFATRWLIYCEDTTMYWHMDNPIITWQTN
jgi:hypothetical protein